MTLVTIAASYGAGGSRIAPALAERLGVPFLGRPGVPELLDRSEEPDERPTRRLLSKLASMAVAWGTPAGLRSTSCCPTRRAAREFEQEVQAVRRDRPRGDPRPRRRRVLLRDDPPGLHVLLDGRGRRASSRRWRSRQSTAPRPSAGSRA